jgi:F420-dependent oxidoreductase-like protein
MRIGINGNHLVGEEPLEQLAAHMRGAAEDGLTSYWAAQHPLGGKDALISLAVAGPQAPRIELGTSVIPVYPRHPLALAAQAATLDRVLGGRLTLGVGLSHRAWIESLGYSYAHPARYMREYLSILVPLLTRGEVDFRGEFLRCSTQAALRPTRPIPVLVGALAPAMLKVAGELAAGTTAVWVGPKGLREHLVPAIRRAAEAAGRAAPRVVATLPVCVTDDVGGARARAERAFALRGELPSYQRTSRLEGASTPAALSIIGSEAEVEDRIRELFAAGATDFCATEFEQTPDEHARTRALLRRLAV